jgi:hypothetical protein
MPPKLRLNDSDLARPTSTTFEEEEEEYKQRFFLSRHRTPLLLALLLTLLIASVTIYRFHYRPTIAPRQARSVRTIDDYAMAIEPASLIWAREDLVAKPGTAGTSDAQGDKADAQVLQAVSSSSLDPSHDRDYDVLEREAMRQKLWEKYSVAFKVVVAVFAVVVVLLVAFSLMYFFREQWHLDSLFGPA